MHELLKKLLAAEVLTEETRQELEQAFQTQMDEAMNQARADAVASVTAQLNEQWITERETLIEALDAKVTEVLSEELEELRESIESFRDLEAEYAEKLVEAKDSMAQTLKSDIAALIEQLDSFLQIQLEAELEELRDSINEVKKYEFGKKVFESFVAEFKKHYAGDDSIEAKLSETETRLQDTMEALEEAERKAAKLDRSIKLEKVLSPLSGRTREVMEAILKNVETPMLEDAYKTYIGRVLKESSKEDTATEKETTVLAEGEKKPSVSGVVKTGNDNDRLIEEATRDLHDQKQPAISDAERARMRRLAGLQ